MKYLLIIVLMFATGCFSASWDEDTLKVTRIGGKEEMEDVHVETKPDGSFKIKLGKVSGDSTEDFKAFMATLAKLAEYGQTLILP